MCNRNRGRALAVMAAAALGMLVTVPAWAQPQHYTVVELDVAETATSTATDINNSGVVVGQGVMHGGAGAASRAVLWSDGVLTDLGSLNGSWNSALGISDDGEVVGWSSYSIFRPFVWTDGSISSLFAGEPKSAAADAINRGGTAVGQWHSGPGSRTTAVSWHNGTMSVLPTLNPCTTCLRNDEARDINDSGQIVGTIETPSKRAAWWHNGTVTDLGTLGGHESAAFGINANGDVVGESSLPPGAPTGLPTRSVTRAFLWRGGTMSNLGTLGNNGSSARPWVSATPGAWWATAHSTALRTRGSTCAGSCGRTA